MTLPNRHWSLLNTDVRDLFKKQGRLVDDAFLKELLAVLIGTDMGTESAQSIVDEVGARFRARVVEMDDLLASVKAKLKETMPER
jgi:fused signal recognition particle receptor